MAEIINLTDVRKRRARAEKESRAERNRAAHGRTKAEKARDEGDREQLARQLDQHKLEDKDDD